MAKKHIKKPQHIRQVLAEQINILREAKNLSKNDMERARTIAHLCNVALTAMKYDDLDERIKRLEELQEANNR